MGAGHGCTPHPAERGGRKVLGLRWAERSTAELSAIWLRSGRGRPRLLSCGPCAQAVPPVLRGPPAAPPFPHRALRPWDSSLLHLAPGVGLLTPRADRVLPETPLFSLHHGRPGHPSRRWHFRVPQGAWRLPRRSGGAAEEKRQGCSCNSLSLQTREGQGRGKGEAPRRLGRRVKREGDAAGKERTPSLGTKHIFVCFLLYLMSSPPQQPFGR